MVVPETTGCNVFRGIGRWERERMIKRFFVAVVLLILVACRQTGQTPSEFGASTPAPLSFGSSADDNSGGVAINAKIGAVFVTGSTYGSLDGPNQGGSDGYVRRYSRGGRVVWRRQFGTEQYDYAGGVATDEEANVYVVGGTYGPTSQKAFIRKFNKNGTPIWTRVFSINGRSTYAGSVRTDKNGYVYVAGGISDDSPSSAFPSYLRNYTPSGSVVWTRRQDTGGVSTEATSLGTDWQGNTYVGGRYRNDDYEESGYIFKYNSSGRLLWSKYLGTGMSLLDLEVRGDRIYVTGDVLTYDLDDFDYNAYVRKYTTDGSVLWTRQFGSNNGDGGWGISADSQGNAYVTGYTFGSFARRNLGNSDIYVRKYGRNGGVSWTRQFGSSQDDYPRDITTSEGGGETYLFGTTNGNIGGPNHGGYDAFFRRLNGSDGSSIWTD